MSIVNKLTLRHLKENKGRTIVTTLGICVSVAMITAVFVALASFLNLFGEIELLASGNFHATLNVNQAQLEALKNDERIAEIGIVTDEENHAYQIDGYKIAAVGIGEFYSGDSTCMKQIITGDYDGEIPSKPNEIAVEQKIIDKNNLNWKIGDTVEIPIGYRYYVADGEEYELYGGYAHDSDEFMVNDIGEYKITAILHSNPATVFNGIIRCCDVDLSNGSVVGAQILLNKVNHNSLKEIKDIIRQYNIENFDINTAYLETKFAYDENSRLVNALVGVSAIILVIIIIASVVLIYNAFAMSISERVRYLGMLASVGATKAQKRLSVYYESFILGIIGIPLGVAGGLVGIGITLKSLGSKIISTGMIKGISRANTEMKIVVPVWVVIGIVLLSALTILISSFIPSRKASKITPIDAIRQTSEVKVKAKRLRSSRLVRLIFGYEGELADKNLKRNGRKARVITASIALSVILFLSCNYFCYMFTQSIGVESEVPYQVNVMVSHTQLDDLCKKLSENANVNKLYSATNYWLSVNADTDHSMQKEEYYTSVYKSFLKQGGYIFINAVDDSDFNALCKANGLDYRDYYTDELKLVVMNNVSHKGTGSDVFSDKLIGTTHEDLSGSWTISGFVKYDSDNYICRLNPQNSISFYAPLSQYIKNEMQFVDDNLVEPSVMVTIGIETDNHEKLVEELDEIRNETGIDFMSNDIQQSVQLMNTLSFVIQVLVYGFITLISFITIFNIINTISTGIAMRKKEFAMLKSVGTTSKGFNKMIMLESAFYGIKSLLFALPISALIAYFMNMAMGIKNVPFEINWLLYLIVVVVVLVVIGATMLYSVHKLRNDSIVETLKAEIN